MGQQRDLAASENGRAVAGPSRRAVIASAISFLIVAVIFLLSIGLDVEVTKEVRGDRVLVRDRREFYSAGTLFVLDPIMGETAAKPNVSVGRGCVRPPCWSWCVRCARVH